MKTNFQIGQKVPEMQVNNPPEKKFWQKPGHFSIWYFILMMMMLYFYQAGFQVKNEEIPYSQFQKYLEANQISECVIKEKVITGTLKLTDQKTGKPRHFITVPLHYPGLSEALEKHGVKYSVAVENHF